MTLPVQKQPVSIQGLEGCDTFGEPIGPLPDQSYLAFHKGEGFEMGVWECGPGKMKLEIQATEFCHLLQGKWTITPEGGEPIVLEVGDSFAFPKGWKGTCECSETIRKAYTFLFF